MKNTELIQDRTYSSRQVLAIAKHRFVGGNGTPLDRDALADWTRRGFLKGDRGGRGNERNYTFDELVWNLSFAALTDGTRNLLSAVDLAHDLSEHVKALVSADEDAALAYPWWVVPEITEPFADLRPEPLDKHIGFQRWRTQITLHPGWMAICLRLAIQEVLEGQIENEGD